MNIIKYIWVLIYFVIFLLIRINSNDEFSADAGYFSFGVTASLLTAGVIYGLVRIFSKKPLGMHVLMNLSAVLLACVPLAQYGLGKFASQQKEAKAPLAIQKSVTPLFVEVPSIILDYADAKQNYWTVRIGYTIELQSPDKREQVQALSDQLSSEVAMAAEKYKFEYLRTQAGKEALSSEVLNRFNKVTGLENSRALLTSFNFIPKE